MKLNKKSFIQSIFSSPKIICVICIFLLAAFIPSDNNDYVVAPGAGPVSAGDMDQDGNMDIVVVNNKYTSPEWNGFSFLMNQGSCNFQFSDSLTIPTAPGFIKIENLDDDPTPEIITQSADCRIRITFNNDISDTVRLNLGLHQVIYCIACADIDCNGYKDIIFPRGVNDKWGIFYNYGNKNFSSGQFFTTGGGFVECNDLNHDGRTDIVISGTNVTEYLNLISGFQSHILEENGARSFIAVADIDLDGNNDVLGITGLPYTNATILRMFKNLGNGMFDTLPVVILPYGSFHQKVIDLDGDTLPDILLLLNDYTGYYIYHNLGGFQFGNPQFISLPPDGEYDRNFECKDIDGNLCPDIVTTKKSGYIIQNVNILYNDGHGNFTPTPYVGIPLKILSDQTISAFPNPFSDETCIQFSLDNPANVNLSIYDLEGKLINCLINQYLKGGTQSIKWRRLDTNGKSCKPGAYIIYLKVNGQIHHSIKIIMY